MSKQTDYTAEEWKTVASAPVLAGLLVSVSDLSGPIGMAKEAFTVVKTITDTAATSSNELIKAVAADIRTRGGKPELPNMPQDRAAVSKMLINRCQEAVELVAKKSPNEAEEYKRWLLSLAQKTAEASKEGGFLGIGGTLVSDEESHAVDNLASALGMSAKA
jgi:hypothetical protein